MGDAPAIEVHEVDAARWPDLERLFGRAGADNGCWCQYWLLGAEYHRRERARNRDDLRSQASATTAGLLAYRDDEPVGWARLTARSGLPWLTTRFPRAADADEPAARAADAGGSGAADSAADAWSLPCFYIARSARGAGVMRALIGAATSWADARRATLEGYPIDPRAPGATRNRFSGIVSAFTDAGFAEVDRLARDRVLVRRRPR